MALHCDLNRMKDKISTFSKFGDAGHGGITRFSLSPEAHQARDEFVRRMKAIGCTIETDDLANIYATLPGSDPALPRLAMGSHADSVRCGGNYDGILGVMGGMEVLETVHAQNIPHKHPLTAMIWTNEEGACYPPAMMCSGVVTGKFGKAEMLAVKSMVDPEKTFGDALKASKYCGDEKNRFSAKKYASMVELHIEQGPILEAAKKDVGVVTCVLGMVNYRIRARGQADHAGTTPMPYRRDALLAAAQALLWVHEKLDALKEPQLVYTTGEIVCHPCVHTVIPDMVEWCIDARHESPEVIRKVVEVLTSMPKEFAKCQMEVIKMWARDTVYFNKDLVAKVKKSVEELGISHQYINSGAGHDAQYVSYVVPTTMIFVPSKDGHSHCEMEYTSPEQCTAGASVMLNTMLKIDHDF